MYLKALSFCFATLARFLEMRRSIIRDHPLGILHPAKIALSLWITVCFDVQAVQDRIFVSNPQSRDRAFAAPQAQISVKGLSLSRVSMGKNNNSSAMCL